MVIIFSNDLNNPQPGICHVYGYWADGVMQLSTRAQSGQRQAHDSWCKDASCNSHAKELIHRCALALAVSFAVSLRQSPFVAKAQTCSPWLESGLFQWNGTGYSQSKKHSYIHASYRTPLKMGTSTYMHHARHHIGWNQYIHAFCQTANAEEQEGLADPEHCAYTDLATGVCKG